MTNKEKANIAVEAAKIRKDYPHLMIKEAIEEAKEVMNSESFKMAGSKMEYSR
jgi:hypothetical protein